MADQWETRVWNTADELAFIKGCVEGRPGSRRLLALDFLRGYLQGAKRRATWEHIHPGRVFEYVEGELRRLEARAA